MLYPRLRAVRPLALLLTLAAALPACSSAAPPVADADEASRILELLRLQPGQSVADVGAGDGEWAAALLDRVGPGGRLWVTEVDDDLLATLGERFAGAPVEVVRGDQDATGLPAGCCEAILLRLVYHHFTAPATMRRALAEALRPGGLLLVVDMEPRGSLRELPEVPDRGGHGVPLGEVAADFAADGWEELAREPAWPGHQRFALLFRRPTAAAAAED